MSKRKYRLPKKWPGHSIRHADVTAAPHGLSKHQDPKGAPFLGERFVFALLEKTPAELKKFLDTIDNEMGKDPVDLLVAAEASLKKRLHLVAAAIARVAIASGVAPWVDPDQPEEGAHV